MFGASKIYIYFLYTFSQQECITLIKSYIKYILIKNKKMNKKLLSKNPKTCIVVSTQKLKQHNNFLH